MSTTERPPAPPRIEFVRTFVNSLNIEKGTDEIDTPERFRSFLIAEGLPPGEVDERELAWVHQVREALRSLALANNEGTTDRAAAEVLDDASRRVGLTVRFAPGGSTVEVSERDRGAHAAIGELLAIVHDAMRDGTWPRFKACRSDDCRWAFYDSSRNRSGHWCTMAVCGNRQKARAYRRRYRS